MDKLMLRLPVAGVMLKKVYMARFCRGMASLLASGVPMLNAIDIVKDTINNQAIAESLETTMTEVRGGKALSTSLSANDYFMKVVPQMVKIGEDSGAIDAVLDKLAAYFEQEVDEAVKVLSESVEPVLMVVMGATVGTIMVAVLLPIYSLVSSIQ